MLLASFRQHLKHGCSRRTYMAAQVPREQWASVRSLFVADLSGCLVHFQTVML